MLVGALWHPRPAVSAQTPRLRGRRRRSPAAAGNRVERQRGSTTPVPGRPHVIPYKIKPGRDLPALKKAYRQLLSHLEGTCGSILALADSSRWSALCSTAAGAARKSELDAIEDEIDAIFCAYLAWLWGTDREGMVVLGDYATGYIVTPTPPRPTALHGRPVRS
jgi:predicted RNase H-like nuclease